MGEWYRGYDVLNKRHTPSWNEQTRKVVDERLVIDPVRHAFCTDALLAAVQQGKAHDPAWGAALFFAKRLLHDVVGAYYTHPVAWNEIGFAGPASPRGYVRLALDRRDPWEAAEAHPGEEEAARRANGRVG